MANPHQLSWCLSSFHVPMNASSEPLPAPDESRQASGMSAIWIEPSAVTEIVGRAFEYGVRDSCWSVSSVATHEPTISFRSGFTLAYDRVYGSNWHAVTSATSPIVATHADHRRLAELPWC